MAKNKKGRPTKYKAEYCEEIIEFFAREPYEWKTKQVATKNGPVEVDYMQACDLPTLAGFAITLEVCRDTLHEWSKVHSEFSDAIKRAKDYQHEVLVQNGVHSNYDKAFGIFAMKNTQKWSDRQHGESDVNINISLADKVAKARSRVTKK